MKNGIFRKGFACAIIILFVGASVASAFNVGISNRPKSMNRGNILYVGGSGPGNYSKIQDAIDNATNGDTVYVFDESSPYYEHLKVDTTINLLGENRDTTIIDGKGERKNVVEITAAQVIISGFTIQNSSWDNNHDWAGIYINGDADGVTITGNNITKNDNPGIEICTSNNLITDNFIINNPVCGIYIWQNSDLNIYSNHNIITGNTIIDGRGFSGIELVRDTSYNIIENNNIITCGDYGIYLDNSHYNKIQFNNISDHLWCGISLWNSQYNNISFNLVLKSGYWGIDLGMSCSNNKICDNFIDSGGGNALEIYAGCYNFVIGNIVNRSTEGIILHDVHGTLVQDNFVNNCRYEGIELERHREILLSDNVIFNNTVDNCGRYGIKIRGTTNTIIQNNRVNNTERGIELAWENTIGCIQGNIISNSSYGMDFAGRPSYDVKICNYKINSNTLINNHYGIYHYYSENNTLFHNNFINNTQNAFETFDNTWYSSWVEEGNYWSDFDEPGEGAWDNDNDGIIDSPYYIPGHNNQDLFPLAQPYSNNPPLKPSRPSGDVSGKPWKIYEYSTITTDFEGDQIYYWFDWGDGTNSGWVGPFSSGENCYADHTWTKKGTYSVRVKAMDSHGEESLWSDPLAVSMPLNQPNNQNSNSQINPSSNPNQQISPSVQQNVQLLQNLIYNLILRHQMTR